MEPFKNVFNELLISDITKHIKFHFSEFDETRFKQLALNNLENLELKERSYNITKALGATLPEDFSLAVQVLLKALHPQENSSLSDSNPNDLGLRGWAIMPITDYVAKFGREHFELSMRTLAEMTKRFSSEFSVRYFVEQELETAIQFFHDWSLDDNYHVRRLASEGIRPRLPWGIQLKELVIDPEPIIPILENLKDDVEEYVRRSVANNLNDISKDHPDLVADIAERWLEGASKNRQRLVRHACRSLIKQGHPKTLKVFGFKDLEIQVEQFQLSKTDVVLGECFEVQFSMSSSSNETQKILLDYAVHHQKANGETTAKVFKWKTFDLRPNQNVELIKKHTIKPITTRVYYPGIHKVEILLNGKSTGIKNFNLTL